MDRVSISEVEPQWTIERLGKELVKKRRLLSPTLAGRLGDGYDLRRLADYERRPVGKKRTKRVLDGAREFVVSVREVVTK